MKPGIKTSEFWATAMINVVGVLAVFGVITPEQSTQLTKVAVPVAGLLAMGVSQLGYAISRGLAKKEQPVVDAAGSTRFQNPVQPLTTDRELSEAFRRFAEKDTLVERGDIKRWVVEALREFSKKETLIE